MSMKMLIIFVWTLNYYMSYTLWVFSGGSRVVFSCSNWGILRVGVAHLNLMYLLSL